MSWSDDIRCLFCDGRLPLYRKITNGQFCSTAHRKAYWEEQERLGIERLHQTHTSLRAYRPPGAVEAILGYPIPEPQPEESAPAGLAFQIPEPASVNPAPALIAADPLAYEADLDPYRPLWAPQCMDSDEVPMAGSIHMFDMPQPRWLPDCVANLGMDPIAPRLALRRPLHAILADRAEILLAARVKMPLASRPTIDRASDHVASTQAKVLPVYHLTLNLTPASKAARKNVPLLDEQIPRHDRLHPIPQFHPQKISGVRTRTTREPWPAAVVLRARLPFDGIQFRPAAASAGLALAGLRRLPLDQTPLVQGAWIDNLRAIDPKNDIEAPHHELATPALRPRLRLAAGSRYAVETRNAEIVVADLQPAVFSSVARNISLPAHVPGSSTGAVTRPSIRVPNPGGLLPLACNAKPSEPGVHSAPVLSLPQPPRTQPMRPTSHLEPLDAKPIADFMPAPAFVPGSDSPGTPLSSSSVIPEPPSSAPRPAHFGSPVIGFWKHAPRDLKLLVFAIPVLLGLALHPSLPKVHLSAPATAGGIQKNFERTLNAQWTNVRQSMVDRAGVALDEDFRTGLDDWTTRGNATSGWEFDSTGFVRPGPLALYKPSIDLTDYQMQFLGLIDKKALSWVVRAADFDNYYVVKLVVLKPGPLPTVGVIRYAVIQGKALDRVDTVVPISAREEMLYRVRLDVRGDNFTLAVQDQMVDSWSETRLRHGGVGFFGARGEDARLRWVQVTHQYDMLGRLCAYLAPYNISSTNGGWQR